MRDQAKEGFDILTGEYGYSPIAAAGILGNFAAESRFNTGARNAGDGRDGSDSIGIGQWNADRARGLIRYAQANQMHPRDLRTQIGYADWELNNTHRGALDGLMRAKTPTEAAAAFVTGFERPKGSDRGAQYAHGWADRDGHANAIFKAFGSNASAGTQPAARGGLEVLDDAPAATAPQPRQASAQGYEILDDPDVPVAGAAEAGFFIPPAPGQGAPTMVGQPSPGFEVLDDEPAPRLTPGQAAPAGTQQRGRVRVSLPAVDNDPERAARIAEYERQAQTDREGQSGLTATADTAVRGLARAVPFMDDIAAAGRYATGGASSYQDALDHERAINRTDDERAPVTSYGAQMAGGLALPGGALASSGLKGAAAVGAGYGALYGAGQGDGIGDRANKAITGAGLGGALGAGSSAALTGLGAAGRFAADKAGVPLGIARGAIDPEAEAARRIAAAGRRDAALPGAQDDAHMLAAAREGGQPVALLDEGGETTRALARSAANTSPEARGALQGMVADRNQGQAERVADFIGNITNATGDTTAVREGLEASARKANRPAYAKAYAEGAGGIWDDGLAALTAAPAVQTAIAKATKTGANRAVADGFPVPQNPFARGADGVFALRAAEDGTKAVPSLQFWDHVKRNLDDAWKVASRAGRDSEAGDIDALRKGLVGRLDEAAPSFADARAGAAKWFGAENASEAGEKFVTSSMASPDARRALAKMSDAERALFQDGFSTKLIDQVRNLPDRRDVVNSLFASPKARERIQIALGTEKASKLEAFLRIENLMTMSGRAVTGNSTTARQLAEMGLAGGAGAAGGYAFGDGSAGSVGMGAILGGLAKKGIVKVDARVAQRVGEMLSSTDPNVVRKATDQVARQPAFMRAVRGAEEWLSSNLPKVAQPSAPDVNVLGALPRLQGPMPGRAQDEQR
jgi:hypothetical protein